MSYSDVVLINDFYSFKRPCLSDQKVVVVMKWKKHSLDCHIVACMADTPWWCMWMDRWK